MNYVTIAVLVVLFLALLYIAGGGGKCKKPLIEGYRDPIYISREKLYLDWYPRANYSIYGPCSSIFSGHPYYTRAY